MNAMSSHLGMKHYRREIRKEIAEYCVARRACKVNAPAFKAFKALEINQK